MSAAVIERETFAETSTFGDPALEPWHLQLVDYGLCWLRGGERDVDSMHGELIQKLPGDKNKRTGLSDDPSKLRVITTGYHDPDEEPPTYWSQPQIERAGRLHARIIRLPLMAHTLAIQIFYGDAAAKEWPKLPPDEKEKLLRDFVFWPGPPYGINARLKRAGDSRRLGSPNEFLPLLLRAIRILMNGDRMKG